MSKVLPSSKPYIIRGLYKWIIEHEYTPFIAVDIKVPGGNLPEEYAEDGSVVLNIAPISVEELRISNSMTYLIASFKGEMRKLHFPTRAITAIYTRETAQGMFFEVEDEKIYGYPLEDMEDRGKSGSSHLKLVE